MLITFITTGYCGAQLFVPRAGDSLQSHLADRHVHDMTRPERITINLGGLEEPLRETESIRIKGRWRPGQIFIHLALDPGDCKRETVFK